MEVVQAKELGMEQELRDLVKLRYANSVNVKLEDGEIVCFSPCLQHVELESIVSDLVELWHDVTDKYGLSVVRPRWRGKSLRFLLRNDHGKVTQIAPCQNSSWKKN